jgi:hypothetical protein
MERKTLEVITDADIACSNNLLSLKYIFTFLSRGPSGCNFLARGSTSSIPFSFREIAK